MTTHVKHETKHIPADPPPATNAFVAPGPVAKEDYVPEHIMQFFAFAHLPAELQNVSKLFSDVADKVLALPRSPERTVALRKLLEAKDAAVRAAVAK
jgi:hypothetical protein